MSNFFWSDGNPRLYLRDGLAWDMNVLLLLSLAITEYGLITFDLSPVDAVAGSSQVSQWAGYIQIEGNIVVFLYQGYLVNHITSPT